MGSSGYRNTTIALSLRFAPYIEAYHQAFLTLTHSKVLVAAANSPYSNYATIGVDEAFFYTGLSISNYPALYDMFGKHMSGLDIEDVHRDSFRRLFNTEEINNAVAAEMELINEDIIDKSLRKFQSTMRDLNAVITSSFVIGKAVLEDIRVKKLSEISSKAKFELLSDPQKAYATFLNWVKGIVTSYANTIKLYYSVSMDVIDMNYRFLYQNILWPFIVSDFERAALAALRGSLQYQRVEKRQRSAVSKGLLVAQYTLTGLTLGATIGGWWGAVIGAVVGAIVGLAIMLLE